MLVIDANTTAEAAKGMLAECAKLTPLSVKQVILTHSDGDHVNGLSGLPAGLTILAHANCRKDMEKEPADPKLSALQPWSLRDSPAGTLPAWSRSFTRN